MAQITIDVDLPPGVEVSGYQRSQDGHGLEVKWPLPTRCRCENCGYDDVAHLEFKTTPQAIRDLNLWEQPCFWIYQAPFHRCARCNYRQHLIPPFKRKDVSYTYRFEQFVLRSLIGSTAEDVARRLGIAAETVERIVENQLVEERPIDPDRVITDLGLDELSLKKRHKLYVTLMTDLSDPTRPRILAVERGRDTDAALKCLDRLTESQRHQVRTHRVDMGAAYPAACALRLSGSRAVTDRFHVAKKFNEVVDKVRKHLTHQYKAKLTKDQRKAFRSQMWAFRRDPESLSAEEKQALETLLEKIPALKPLYTVRLRFKEIFDTARDRVTAARWLRKLRRQCDQLGLNLGPCFETYDRWKTEILNDFDARQTSAAVEGINNKARVITKRAYGLKSAKSLWDRLILDLNRAAQAIGDSIAHIRQIAKGLKALFDWSCT
jgi:transposase